MATKPCGSSISASSAPAVYAWMHAVMSLSLLCELSFGSTTSGYGRRTCTVNSVMPFSTTSGRGTLCSAMITTVAGPIVTRGSWYGVLFTPRVTISRTCTPSRMSLARNVSEIASVSSSRVRPMSIAIAFAPSNSRSRCCAEERGAAVVDAQALPDAVTQDEAAVEDRHHGLRARHQRAVHVDEHLGVAGVVVVVLRTLELALLGHHQRSPVRRVRASCSRRSTSSG